MEAPERWQRTVARRSAEARATVPDLELSAEVELDEHAAPPTLAVLVRACALALREVPRANAAYRDGQFELYSRVNVGVVVAAPSTYTIPTVPDADLKSVAELEAALESLCARALAGRLGAPDLAGATFTLWYPGADGVASAVPLIVPPQAAALAVGTVRRIGAVRGGIIVPGSAMTITLACDHRILYGAQASRFLGRIKTLLQEGTP